MDNVKAVAAGLYQTLILKTDNTLWGNGLSWYGSLGIPYQSAGVVTPIKLMDDVLTMDVGAYHSLVLKTDNTLWVSGGNYNGQLGIGTDGSGTDLFKFTKVASNVQAIAAGIKHSMMLKTDNTLWATGSNRDGQLGNGTQTNRNTFGQVMGGVSYVVTGGGTGADAGCSYIIKTDNTLWSVGSNIAGVLGFASPPSQTSVFVPIVVK